MSTEGNDPLELARRAVLELPRQPLLDRLDELVAANPDNDKLIARRTLVCLSVGDIERAQAFGTEHLARSSSAEALAARAVVLDNMGERVGARAYVDQALAVAPESSLVLHVAATILVADDGDRGISLATKLCELYPESRPHYHLLIKVHRFASRPAEARRLIDDAPPWFVGTSWHAQAKGIDCMVRVQPGEAERWFRSGAAMRPNNDLLWTGLAVALDRQGRLADAETAANFALDYNPRNAGALHLLASIAKSKDRSGDVHALRVRTRQALAGRPGFEAVLVGAEEFATGDVPGAIRCFRDAIRRSLTNREKAVARLGLVTALVYAGSWTELRRELDGLPAEAFDAQTRIWAEARLLEHDGRLEEAAARMSEATDTDGRGTTPRADLMRLWDRLGQSSKVDAMTKDFRGQPPDSPQEIAIVVIRLKALKRFEDSDTMLREGLRRFPASDSLLQQEAWRLVRIGERAAASRVLMRLPTNRRAHLLPKGNANRRWRG